MSMIRTTALVAVLTVGTGPQVWRQTSPGSWIEKTFVAQIGEAPRLGWFVSGNRFVAPERLASLVVYGPTGGPLAGRFVGELNEQQTTAIRQREHVACDLEAGRGLSVYAVTSGRSQDQGLYTSRPLPGTVRSGLIPVTLSPSEIAAAVSLLHWKAPARVQRHDAFSAVPGGMFYSFHRRFDEGSGTLREEALILHDGKGRAVAHEMVTLDEDQLCDGCGLPDLNDGRSFAYRVLNVFQLPGFVYPVLLLNTGTVEGRALSLTTFARDGKISEFRLYEYIVNCDPDSVRPEGNRAPVLLPGDGLRLAPRGFDRVK